MMTPQEKQIREIDRRLREVERNIPRTMGRIAVGSGGDDLIRVKTFDDLPDASKIKPGRRGHVESVGWFLIVTAPEAWGGDSEEDDNQWCPDSFVWKFPPNGEWPD
jgi:hypothetical protein